MKPKCSFCGEPLEPPYKISVNGTNAKWYNIKVVDADSHLLNCNPVFYCDKCLPKKVD